MLRFDPSSSKVFLMSLLIPDVFNSLFLRSLCQINTVDFRNALSGVPAWHRRPAACILFIYIVK